MLTGSAVLRRSCSWPQEVTLQLEGVCRVQQIHVLSHEYKARCSLWCWEADGISHHSNSPHREHNQQMLSAPLQIASKVELHVGLPGSSGGDIEWRRLGSFSFDAKERSNLQSRELKSVTVNVRAALVRVVLSRCHTNQLNTHNQARRGPLPFGCVRQLADVFHACLTRHG